MSAPPQNLPRPQATEEPVLTRWGERLRERTQPLAVDDEDYGYVHAHLCEGLSKIFEQVGAIYDPPDPFPPGAPLLDVRICPDFALPWLAQVYGARLPPGLTAVQQRAYIASVAGWKRGTPAAMRAAVALTLVPLRPPTPPVVYFRERYQGDPYALDILTIAAETPDPERTWQAALAQKPAAIVLTVRQVEAWDWEQVPIEYATWAEATAAFATWADFATKTPRE